MAGSLICSQRAVFGVIGALPRYKFLLHVQQEFDEGAFLRTYLSAKVEGERRGQQHAIWSVASAFAAEARVKN